MKSYNQLMRRAYQNKLMSYNRMMAKKNSKFAWKEEIDSAYKLIPNEPRINQHNTLSHELSKAKLCYLLKKQNLVCYCEVIFKKGRCDILVPETMTIYEILETETIEQFSNKLNYYPELYSLIPLKAEDVLKEGFVI